MQVLHKTDKGTISKEIEGDVAFLLGNKNSGYIYLSSGKRSRYEGVFFQLNNKVYRVIADLALNGDIERIINRQYCIERCSSKNSETFFIPHGLNSISYELKREDWIRIYLDIRESYDTGNKSSYEVSEDEEGAIIKCIRGDDEFFVAIKSERSEYEEIDKFKSVYYEKDRDRNSPPFEMPIYCALKLRSKRIAISFSDDKETAINESEYVFNNLEKIKREQEGYVKGLIKSKDFRPDEIDLAYRSCVNSLDQLTTPDGIIAGFPWFFQYWTRDELVSLKNLDREIKRKILLRDLNHLTDDGRIPNILSDIDSSSGSADAVGWLFKRIDESLEIFSNEERKFIRERLMECIGRLNENYVKDLLIFNRARETWMDTYFNDNGREGARIEIQSLFLNMYKLAYRLTKNERFSLLEKMLRERVREKFWDNEILKDGLDDPTIRPNVFIAAYVYPELLSREEWIKCFENILPRLWCEWGGLASIDKENPLFLEHSTGEDPRSYHRGDSWYFLNNLAALVMYKMDKIRFKKYIDKIVKASTEDILWHGMIGHHSEISSASEQKAQGCGAQAWSDAMYLELIDEIF
ncbi:MAG: hypothetical protein B6U86_01665 [Candidatus Altiarchaeales archaeon ex4484_43]|nr:MAG: hypothetical protein B6U86_01665 [Candidatus Altiarchaeales archaeon ex4484_43]